MPPKSQKSFYFGLKETLRRKREGVVDFETLALKADVADLKKQLIDAELRLFNAKKEALSKCRYPSNKKRKLCKTNVQSGGIKDSIEEADRLRLETNLELYESVTGIKVSFSDGSRYCVMYEICLDGEVVGKHAIEILKDDELSKIGKCSMPLGFQYKAIVKSYRDICVEDFVLEIHQALVAYYSRLRQIQNLKKIKSNDHKVFCTNDGTMVELSYFVGHSIMKWTVSVCVRFTYTLTEDMPSSTEILAQGLEPEFVSILEDHLVKFVEFPLDEAFVKFMDDFSFQNGNFAIILKRNFCILQDRPAGKEKAKAKQSRIQNSREYLSDADLHLHDDSDQDSVSDLQRALHDANKKQRNSRKRPVKSPTRPQEERIVRPLRSNRENNIHKVRLNGHSSSQVRHLSLTSSKYVPSESDFSSEDEQPVINRKKVPVQKRAVVSVAHNRSKQNSQVQSSTSTPAAYLPEHRIHRRLLIKNTLKNDDQKLKDEKAEEDELDMKAIKKVKEWLRTTPLPEEMLLT